MSNTRRNVLHSGAITLASAGADKILQKAISPPLPIHRALMAGKSLPHEGFSQLIRKSIEAAMSSGAAYADARLTFTRNLTCSAGASPFRSESMVFGVRALVNGYWGYASSPVWNAVEANRLGHAAAAHASANVLGYTKEIELAEMSDARSGHWLMPVQDDPFKMAYEEIWDFLSGIESFIRRLKYYQSLALLDCSFTQQSKMFGSSEEQYTSQLVYRTTGRISFTIQNPDTGRSATATLDCLTPAGLGFEYLRDQPLREKIVVVHEEAMRDLELPILPVDVGRFATLVNPIGMASLISQSFGASTQIDRSLGYEANAGGTSFITDPTSMLGTLKIGNDMVNITGSRSEPGSVGRVEWDDEGVKPGNFQLIKNGVLVNMQTSREGASWIKEHYNRTGVPVQSTGCAYSPTAIDPQLIHSADLTLRPGTNESDTLETLRGGMDDGVEFQWPGITLDFQQITGLARGKAYKITKGKRSALLEGAGMIFRTPELWGNVIALGGQASAQRFGVIAQKGEPQQIGYHSVTTPPVLLKEMSIVDIKRKA